MYVLDKRNTLWLRDTVRQTSLRKSEAGRPLTSLGMSAWPYRVTTKYTYYIYHSRYSILSYILWESASIFHCHINVCCTDFFRRHMYIFYHSSALKWGRWLKVLLVEDKDIFILYLIISSTIKSLIQDASNPQNLNVSRLLLQLSLCNILKPGVQLIMKM